MLSIDKISFKSIDAVICNIKHITLKSLNHVNIDSENPLYVIFNNVDGYDEESNGDKYLIVTSTDNNKEVLKKYVELWDKVKNQIETINGAEPIDYKKDFMKSRFESDDDLPLDKIISIPDTMVVIRSVFQENSKHYPQICLHECVYEAVGEL